MCEPRLPLTTSSLSCFQLLFAVFPCHWWGGIFSVGHTSFCQEKTFVPSMTCLTRLDFLFCLFSKVTTFILLKKICSEKDLFRFPSVFFSLELARKHSVETGTYFLNVLQNPIIIYLTRTLPAMLTRIFQSFFSARCTAQSTYIYRVQSSVWRLP